MIASDGSLQGLCRVCRLVGVLGTVMGNTSPNHNSNS